MEGVRLEGSDDFDDFDVTIFFFKGGASSEMRLAIIVSGDQWSVRRLTAGTLFGERLRTLDLVRWALQRRDLRMPL